MNGTSPVNVAVGVVKNSHQKILISERPASKTHGGCWEFPGGKIKPGETVIDALSRELYEELNLTLEDSRRLITIRHNYDEYPVKLDVRLVHSWHGSIHGREGQAFKWVDINRLSEFTYPAANNYILSALSLPELYFITPEAELFREGFLDKCEKIIKAGCRMIQFRCKSRPFTDSRTIFNSLLKICSKNNCKLLLNSTPEEALNAGASGCHLSSSNLMKYQCRALPHGFILGGSCHNIEELNHAEEMKLDFVVLGSVYATASHHDSGCLGWDGFQKLAAQTNLPVYAIGGMQMKEMETAWDYGAQGLASISNIWQRPGNENLDLLYGKKMINV